MGMAIAEQTQAFAWSGLLGAGLAMLYDFFRLTRVAFRLPRWVVLLEDMLYFTLCAVLTFFFLLETGDGQLRWYILVGELLGAVLYWTTIGAVIMKLATAIVRTVSAVLWRIFQGVMRPIARLLRALKRVFGKARAFLRLKSVKIRNYMKYSLKKSTKALYNKLSSHKKLKEPQ